ncbi:MAG: Hpt domain-containing protein [Rubrivivax sp.]
MAAFKDTLPTDDLSALAWVQNELRRSLDTAHKSLRRYLKESEVAARSDLDTVDPAGLRTARTQLHQGVGALELVGLPSAARMLRASEAAVQRMLTRPALVTEEAVHTIERASFALLDYLARTLAGKVLSPIGLFPQYAAVQALAGADRVHPADLWESDFVWHELPAEAAVPTRAADDAARGTMEAIVLRLMRRADPHAWTRLSSLCAELAAGSAGRAATLWQLAAAFAEAEAAGLLPQGDLHTKRVAARLLAQLRLSSRHQDEPSERLAHDLLFFCAHARPASVPTPRLDAVRRAWRLPAAAPIDYEHEHLGRFDPAWIAQARKRVAGAKDVWSAVAGGEEHRLPSLPEQMSLLADSVERLFPGGPVLVQALQDTTSQVVAAGGSPPAALSMEVATAILYLDATLEDGELDAPDLESRVRRLAQRITEARGGGDPQPLESWMEELYRRVSDRQTMGSVVHELRASLSEVEKEIDQYFRDPSKREVLIPVPGQLSAMRGVLSVLGLDQASQAVVHMRDSVDELAQTEVDPQQALKAGTFDRLADNLGALSFLIDMLSVQPHLAKSLFRFDPVEGSLSAVMGQSDRASTFGGLDALASAPMPLADEAMALADSVAAQPQADHGPALEALSQRALAADLPGVAGAVSSAQRALAKAHDAESRQAVGAELAQSVAQLIPPAAAPVPMPPPAPAPAAPVETMEDDAEMREIFLEEAREVIDGARQALRQLVDDPADLGGLTTVRRAFHTLKGSSRMVGLRDYGEAAWACEQLYNARLAQAPRLDADLQAFTVEALDHLSAWTDAIAAGEGGRFRPEPMVAAADSLRLQGRRIPMAASEPPAVAHAESPAAALQTLPELPVLEEPALPELKLELEPEATPDAAPLPAGEPAPWPRTVAHVSGAAAATAAALPALADRVPDLPSAADLELPAAPASLSLLAEEPVAAPLADAAQPVPTAESIELPDLQTVESISDFHLDLGQPDVAPAPATAAPDAPPPLPDLAEVVELDLADLDLPAAPAPAPTAESPAADILDLSELTQPLLPEVTVGEVTMPLEGPAPDFRLDGLDLALPAAALVQPTPPGDEELIDLDQLAGPETPPAPQPAAEPVPDEVPEAAAEDDQVKVIGPLRIPIPLFNIYLNEADELSRRLCTELAEWGLEHDRRPVSESAVVMAHSLAGNSATVGYTELSTLARALEHTLVRSAAAGPGRPDEPALFNEAADEIRRLLHQFAAGFLKPMTPGLLERLAEHERLLAESAPPAGPPSDEGDDDADALLLPQPQATSFAALGQPAEPVMPARARPDAFDDDDDIEAVDAIDAELFPIFEEEAEELLPQLQTRLREWALHPSDADAPAACMRTLHTFKGGARLAGAMRLGEMAHRLETAVEHLAAAPHRDAAQVDTLQARADAMVSAYELLRRPAAAPAAAVAAAPAQPVPVELPSLEPLVEPAPLAQAVPQAIADTAPLAAAEVPAAAAGAVPQPSPVDWSRFDDRRVEQLLATERSTTGAAAVRVRAGLLDRLVNHAGEVSITRARLDADVRQLQGAVGDLTDNLERLRSQLRDIELQAETQITSRIEAAKAASQSFDPLEMDRFTRFQELTRMMAESVNDVATVQRSVQRTLQSTEDELAAQARLTRELQDDLLRTRMVEFDSLSDRLYRVVRQAAKDSGKQVRLDIVGGAIEVDRGVLERMVGPFEHLLRNCVAHGIEAPADRQAAGKDATGEIRVTVTQEGNEIGVDCRDDGRGLDLVRIRERAEQRGLLRADQPASDAELVNLIFAPGFSTASEVTELAGRGVGLDVVRSEVNSMGGRIETASTPGLGTSFRLLLPLTTAVTQVVMLRCGDLKVAVPSTLIEVVRRVPTPEVEQAYGRGAFPMGDASLPFYWLGALLEHSPRGPASGRSQPVVVVRSAAQRVALHVDEVLGNQEVVVKHIGPQLARLPGLAGVTLLPSGAVALIYNPVALAALFGEAAQRRALGAPQPPDAPTVAPAAEAERAPLVLVVDDSLTVRRVTQRLLSREGYRVELAKDGMDALEKLAHERPAVMLSDIEMPRMDGFDLVRNVRADAALARLPVIMITSRIAQKHRDYAAELGVDHYLGKPYAEDELLRLVQRYAGAPAVV